MGVLEESAQQDGRLILSGPALVTCRRAVNGVGKRQRVAGKPSKGQGGERGEERRRYGQGIDLTGVFCVHKEKNCCSVKWQFSPQR